MFLLRLRRCFKGVSGVSVWFSVYRHKGAYQKIAGASGLGLTAWFLVGFGGRSCWHPWRGSSAVGCFCRSGWFSLCVFSGARGRTGVHVFSFVCRPCVAWSVAVLHGAHVFFVFFF